MAENTLAPEDAMVLIDQQMSHIWMVRTFLKHSEEAEEDDELADVHRILYDCMHALGASFDASDAPAYLRAVKKKFGKLKSATNLFLEIQPEISTHMNFQMAARSLKASVEQVDRIMDQVPRANPNHSM